MLSECNQISRCSQSFQDPFKCRPIRQIGYAISVTCTLRDSFWSPWNSLFHSVLASLVVLGHRTPNERSR
jgi:hypothetical protein